MTGPGSSLEGTVFGPWRLLRRTGGGGLGEVYLAEPVEPVEPAQPVEPVEPGEPAGAAPAESAPNGPGGSARHPRQVALKIMRPPAGDALTGRVIAGVERARALRAPHVIPLYGVTRQNDQAAVAMAWAPGGSLAESLARRGAGGQPVIPLPMRPAVVARLITQVGRALAATHAAGLPHGDVKPSNIFIRRSSRGAMIAALSDYGQGEMVAIAVQLAGSGSPMAREPWVQEQLLFTAPERLAGGAADAASDQYALAATAYYLLTGRPPFTGDAAALLTAIPSASLTEPSALLPEAPAGLDDVLSRALARDPSSRFESVEAFAVALERTLATAPGASRVTSEFSRLGGQSTPGAPRPTGRPAPSRVSRRAEPVTSRDLPKEPPAALWRGLALATAAAALIAIVTCGVSLVALNSAGVHPRALLGAFKGPDSQATQIATAPVSSEAASADQELKVVVAQAPTFHDSLKVNANGWAISGGARTFGGSGLEMVNHSTTDPEFADAPDTPPGPDYAGQVTMRFKNGESGDLAGMRFYVTDNGDGTQAYYAFMLAPNGQYYLWYYQDGLHFLAGGYASQIAAGVGGTNTLAFVTHSARGVVTLYVNGSFVADVTLQAGGPAGGGAGLIVLTNGLDVVFSDFALYPAPQGQ